MTTRFGLLISSALLMTSLSALGPVAFAGVGSTGGGTSIVPAPGARPVLLDLYLRDPGFVDRFQLRGTVFTGPARGAIVDIHQDAAYGLVLARLGAWKKSSPTIVEAIQKTIDNTRYIATTRELPVIDAYFAPSSVDPRRLRGAVVYAPGLGAAFSNSVYGQMGDYSKAGTIIHEALRQIQLAYGDGMADETLQDVTARITLTDPRAGETLDDRALYGKYLASLIDTGANAAEKKAAEFCGRLLALLGSEPALAGRMATQRSLCARIRLADGTQDAYAWFRAMSYAVRDDFDASLDAMKGAPEQVNQLWQLKEDAYLYHKQAMVGLLTSNEPELYKISIDLALQRMIIAISRR